MVLSAKNLTLECDAGQLVVEADAGLLSQALGNLLDNAIDFTPRGGQISLRAHEHAEHVVFTVCDNGPGIPDYALERIFERFYSLPRENGQKSSGLGLALVQEVARLHQGTIQVCNLPQGGAEARLTLHRHFT